MFRISENMPLPGKLPFRVDEIVLLLATKRLEKELLRIYSLWFAISPVQAPLPIYLAVYLNNKYCGGTLVECARCIVRLIEYANLNVVVFAFYFFPVYIWIFIRIIFTFVSVKLMQNSIYVATIPHRRCPTNPTHKRRCTQWCNICGRDSVLLQQH